MMPETDPIIDDVALVDFVRRAARDNAQVRIYPAASITKGFEGQEITEFGLLQEAGAIMLTEGKRSIENSLILRRAMTYARDFDMVIVKETMDPHLTSNGVMNEVCLQLIWDYQAYRARQKLSCLSVICALQHSPTQNITRR